MIQQGMLKIKRPDFGQCLQRERSSLEQPPEQPEQVLLLALLKKR
jgi:hypothetical protein